MSATLRILRTSSREQNNLLPERIEELRRRGFTALFDELPSDPNWAYAAAHATRRAEALSKALVEPETTAILCARGGYGASDLLPLLPWAELRQKSEKGLIKPKLLVGFSDVSALHSALWLNLGWQGLHAPMPATDLWGKNGEHRDTDQLLAILDQSQTAGQIQVDPLTPLASTSVKGTLFGGCFSVLTSLIGTPYLPKSLAGHILFFEDIGEHPGRLMRFLNQWLQAGLLQGVQAFVFGAIKSPGPNIVDSPRFVYEEFARRLAVPVFSSADFGHICPNYPLGIGAQAQITGHQLTWNFNRNAVAV